MPSVATMKRIAQDRLRLMREKENIVIHNDTAMAGGQKGDLLSKHSNKDFDMEWIAPANAVEKDNPLPVTSAAVYAEIGDVESLLATI